MNKIDLIISELEACSGFCIDIETRIQTALSAARELKALKPVAWVSESESTKQFVEGRPRRVWWECNTGVGQPLYTAPPRKPWVGLTDEDTANICMQSDLSNWRDAQVIDAAEAKLKEKNSDSTN